MKWRLSLLGGFQLISPTGKLFRTRSGKLKVMLAFVALQNGDGAQRKPLAHALFSADDVPDLPNLAVLLTRSLTALRELSDLPLLAASPDRLSLISDNVTIDALEFEALIRSARQESDPIRAGCLWLQAVQRLSGAPLEDLDHPLLESIKSKLLNGAFEALHRLAVGPLGGQSVGLILERIHTLGIEQNLTTARVETLMRTLAALGLKEELIRLFSSYETQLDYETGEGPAHALAALFNELLGALDSPTSSPVKRNSPARPDRTFGRDALLQSLAEILQDKGGPRIVTLTGQSGIGKTHVLRELYWQLEPQLSVEYVDLEQMPIPVAAQYLASRPANVVIIDHVNVLDLETERLLSDQSAQKIVIASHARLGNGQELVVVVGPLEEDAAQDLICANLDLVAGLNAPSAESDSDIARLAKFCDGIPLALEIAGRLSGSIGVQATITALARDMGSLSYGRSAPNRKTSLHLAIQSSFEHLGEHAALLVGLLAKLGGPCHIDQLLSSTEAMPCDLEEGILAGLIVRDSGGPYVRVTASTAAYVVSLTGAPPMAEFYLRSVDWFVARSEQVPVDLSVSQSLPLAVTIINGLLDAGLPRAGMDLMASLRPWLGSNALAPKDLVRLEVAIGNHQEAPSWAPTVLAIAASYFHSGAFQEMLDHLQRSIELPGAEEVPADHRCQLQMQLALAKRCLNDIGGAIDGYERAIAHSDESVEESTLVKCYYNLGTLLESQDRLAEALEAQDSAADHFSEDTDPRVESLVNACIGRLRYRVENDLTGASLILEATLAHATQRNDRRSMAEILQNLGLIYYERGLAAKAALAETIGSSMLLSFGYNAEFRRLTRSSFVTLACGLLEFGEETLGRAVRGVVDRLGSAELYAPNRAMFEHLQELTYQNPSNLKLSLVNEKDVEELLGQCYEALSQALQTEDSCRELMRIGDLTLTPASKTVSLPRRAAAVAR